MSVIIGSARIDERGRAHGGKAGDQGKEVSTQLWYNRWTNPWVVLRPKNPAHAKLIAACMRAVCLNQHIGYDQWQRDSLYNLVRSLGFDVSKVTTDCETDCSALVRVCLAFAGIMVRSFRTTDEAAVLMATGLFEKLTASRYAHSSAYLREGDILCTLRQGHTGVVLSNGDKAGVTEAPITVTPPAAPEKSYMANWIVATAPVNVRTGPGAAYKKRIALPQGAALLYAGAVSGEWYSVIWRGKACWVSARYATVAVMEKPIVDLSAYNVVKNWREFAKWISFAIFRVGIRSLRSNGAIKLDGRFKSHTESAKAQGVPFAVYFYGRAKTAAGGIEEAKKAVEWAEKYGPTMYFYDIEALTCRQVAVQAFLDYVRQATGKPAGIYVGQRWNLVNAGAIRRDATWCPYYNKGLGGVLNAGKNPSHPHDMHQYSPSAGLPGGPAVVDVSHINTDVASNGTGHTIEWFRSGGKEGN